MSSLSDITMAYIDQTFQPELKAVILRAVSSVFDDAQISSYEVNLIDIISQDELLSSDDIRDMFISSIRQILLDMTRQYLLEVDTSQEPTLLELVQICEAFSLSAKLETVDVISSVLYSDNSPRHIAVGIISTLSKMPATRVMELIVGAKQDVIDAIRSVYSEQEAPQVSQSQSTEASKLWSTFSSFIDNAPCLGTQLAESGFKHLALNALVSLSRYDKHETVQISEYPQIGLDMLSLLMYANDTQTDPINHVASVLSVYVADVSTHEMIKSVSQRIYNDFKLFHDFKSQTKHLQESV